MFLNPLNAELNPICHLLALLGAHHILHVSRVRVNCSTCFGRHTAHHQELKNCNCSLWFYIRFLVAGCRCVGWAIAAATGNQKTYVKPEAAITVLELLMMGGVSPEKCFAIKKHWNDKLYYTAASCWFFLWDLYYDARIDEYQVRQQ
jgi:hypothetical protein